MSNEKNHQELYSLKLAQENKKLKQINQNLITNINILRNKNYQLESIVNNLPQNFWMIDQNDIITFINDGFFKDACHYLNKRADEFIGKNFYELAYELGMSKYEIETIRKDDNEIKTQKISKLIEQNMTTAGCTGTYLTFKSPIFDHYQRYRGLIISAINITELKQRENKLTVAVKSIEKIHLEKINFLENVRHDLHNPLSNIISAADLIKNMLHDSSSHEFLEAIIASGNQVMELFAQLIDFFQTKNQNQPNRIMPVNIKKLLKDINNNMLIYTHKQSIQYVTNMHPQVPEILLTDKTKLNRIISNLIVNAFKYTHQGEVTVTITFDENTEILKIVVKDSGIGIKEEDIPKIFEPLVRLNRDDNIDSYRGLGLGLSIVDQFTRDLNGSIDIKSEVNRGSSFILSIPASYVRNKAELKNSISNF